MLAAWRRFYGENPMHLLALLGCFALVGYLVRMLVPDPTAPTIALWFVGAVVAHDLALYPLYALADRAALAGRWARRRLARGRMPCVPAINHVRVPALGAALLLLLFLPSISRQGETGLLFAAGRTMERYLDAWLLVTAALFLGSAVIYAARLGSVARRGSRPGRQP